MTFWVVAALMTAVVVIALVWPLSRRPASRPAGEADLAVYRDQLDELGRDLARGVLTEAEAASARLEVERRLLSAAGPADASMAGQRGGPGRRGRAVLAGLLTVAVPAGALGLYLWQGQPDLPAQPFAQRDQSVIQQRQFLLAETEALARELEDGSTDAARWMELGRRFGDLGRVDQAVAAFARAVNLSDGDPGATFAYAEALVAASAGIVSAEARGAFERVLEAWPDDPGALLYLAEADIQAGDDRAALDRLQAAMRGSAAGAPWIPVLRDRIAVAAGRLGLDVAEATPEPGAAQDAMIRDMVEGLAARLEEQPGDVEGWLQLGRSWLVLEEPERAAEALRRGREAAPDDIRILAMLGDALLRTGDPAAAPEMIEVMQRTLDLDPANQLALWFLGVHADATGRSEEAVELWTRLLAQLPEESEAWATVRGQIDRVEAAPPSP